MYHLFRFPDAVIHLIQRADERHVDDGSDDTEKQRRPAGEREHGVRDKHHVEHGGSFVHRRDRSAVQRRRGVHETVEIEPDEQGDRVPTAHVHSVHAHARHEDSARRQVHAEKDVHGWAVGRVHRLQPQGGERLVSKLKTYSLNSWMYINTHPFIHACMHTCMQTYIYTYMHTCIQQCMRAHAHMRTHTHTRTHARTHARTHTHTHTHTHM